MTRPLKRQKPAPGANEFERAGNQGPPKRNNEKARYRTSANECPFPSCQELGSISASIRHAECNPDGSHQHGNSKNAFVPEQNVIREDCLKAETAQSFLDGKQKQADRKDAVDERLTVANQNSESDIRLK